MIAWLPGLVVLAIGLAAGLLAGRRFKGARGGPGDHDLELRIADLESRRDDLYRQLRETDEGTARAADRPALEKAAARTLLELDRLAKQHPKAARKRQKAKEAAKAKKTESGAAAPPSPARTFLVGFSYGVGLILLVGALIYWAVRDAEPRPEEMVAAPAPAPDDPHPQGAMPSELASRISSLDSYILNNPEDLEARKELGYILLGAGRYVDAFGQGGQILARNPRDPDGLYMQGVVRLTMGQLDQAQVLLEAAIASDGAHVDSLTALGVLKLRGGDYARAIELWKQALAALGGSQPTIERMIAAAEAGSSPEDVLGIRAPSSPQPEAAPVAAAPAAVAPEPRSDGVTISIDLAPGTAAPPRAILFVSLSGPISGPPAAVRRIESPRFPLTLTLTEDDSMMGAELPESGTVNVRLDADGSASTRGPDDLSASAEARMGEAVSLRLQ